MENINLWSSIGTILLTGALTFTLSRLSKRADYRGQAEATLAGMPVQIITEQNRRLEMLEEQMGRAWERERECYRRLDVALARIGELERKVL